MRPLLDEIRVADDGSLDIRIIEDDGTSSRPYRLVTLEPGDPATDLIRDGALRKIARMLGATSPVCTIVHAGEDRFTVTSADGSLREINETECPQAVAGIRQIADFAAVADSPDRNVLRHSHVLARTHFVQVILNSWEARTWHRFSPPRGAQPGEYLQVFLFVFNRFSTRDTKGMPAYRQPNRLLARSSK